MSRFLIPLPRRHTAMLMAGVGLLGLSVAASAFKSGSNQVGTTVDDFYIGGTQPDMLVEPIRYSEDCVICHGIVAMDLEVAPNWQGSMMAQAGRDPLFYACLTIANQDAADGGDLCLRCHTAKGWLEGRSDPTDGSALEDYDRDGVNCHICHRMVDPVFKPGISPIEDQSILADLEALGFMPNRPGSGSFVIDPRDRRRGPFDFIPPQEPPPHDTPFDVPQFIHSPFHRTSELCATCHDVSNPVYERQPDGSYAIGDLETAHETGDQHDMFPIERTYSEWLNSDYPKGVDAGGRFGGNLPDGVVRTCQDCHMPKRFGNACIQGQYEPSPYPPRPDMPRHDFAGGNTWIRAALPELLEELWPFDALPNLEFLTIRLQEGQERTNEMLQRAATLETQQDAARLDVRVINETGHKLPTGYPEGRRMWINVQFFDGGNNLISERGVYNPLTAELHEDDTTVYEINLGLDAAAAAATGLPEGESFHFVLNNKVYKENRIPPRGFTNAAFDEFGGKPVGATYADGQYWSDVVYAIPAGAVQAMVHLYYQTSSKEYIEFLRDENQSNDWGKRLYYLWQGYGMSEPFLLTDGKISLSPFTAGDHDGDGDADLSDYTSYVDCFTGADDGPYDDGCEVFDFDVDGDVDLADFADLQRWFTGAP